MVTIKHHRCIDNQPSRSLWHGKYIHKDIVSNEQLSFCRCKRRKNVHWDMDELHEIPNKSNDCKSNCDRSANLHKFCEMSGADSHPLDLAVPFCEGFVQRITNCVERSGQRSRRRLQQHTYLVAIPDELLGYFQELANLVRHWEECKVGLGRSGGGSRNGSSVAFSRGRTRRAGRPRTRAALSTHECPSAMS